MPYQTVKDLLDNGYKLSNRAQCNACGADIEWWLTPRGKKMPIDYGTVKPHWATCPQGSLFKKEEQHG